MTQTEKPAQSLRQVRSFVLREGRLTTGQQRAFEQLWPTLGVDFAERRIDLAALFGNNRPVCMEIGFGNGESLAQMAQAHPTCNFLGIEVHRPGVGHLLLRLEEQGSTNVRVMRHDATEVMRHMLDDACLHGVYLFFPDPWHKKRHHKRRILQPTFVSELARIVRPGGFFHAATDWQDYAQQMMSIMSAANPLFSNRGGPGNFMPRPAYRPRTKFEERGRLLGHGVWDLIFDRR